MRCTVKPVSAEEIESRYVASAQWSPFASAACVLSLGRPQWIEVEAPTIKLAMLAGSGRFFRQYNGLLTLIDGRSSTEYGRLCALSEAVRHGMDVIRSEFDGGTLSLHPSLGDIRPFLWLGDEDLVARPRYAGCIEDLSFSGQRPSLRRDLQAGWRAGMTLDHDSGLGPLRQAWLAASYRRSDGGGDEDLQVIDAVGRALLEQGTSVVCLGRRPDSEFAAVFAALCPRRKVGYILFAGSTIRDSRLDAVAWHGAIDWLRARGAGHIDTLGANSRGTSLRKAAWGARPTLYWEISVDTNRSPDHPIRETRHTATAPEGGTRTPPTEIG